MASTIDYERCIGCGICEENCPGDIIHMDADTSKPKVLYPQECWYCGACRMDCPQQCIKIVFPLTCL